ncbi:alpha/beta hydrolase [Archangium violaceum]|uniref:alpha/beta hydrolase n=1 Tax=Archangium violaceum TaxID=83451 RepID=UPI0036DE8E39
MKNQLQTVSLVVTLLSLVGCASLPNVPARDGGAQTSATQGHELLEGARGTHLFQQWWRPEGQPPRAVVVVVHGLKDHGSRYEELARRLVAKNFAVYAMDLRGHAHSEGPRVDVGTFDDYIEDLGAVLERVREREPGLPVFLFGHSMGGMIVTRYTLEHSAQLAGLITHAPALKVDAPGIQVASVKFISALSPNAGLFQPNLDDYSRDPQVVSATKADPLIYQSAAPVHTASELLRAIERTDARMEDITLPVLILHGTADKLTSAEGSKELYRRARSTDKTLKLYPGLFHDLVHEPEKETVLTDITAWLEARAPGATTSAK